MKAVRFPAAGINPGEANIRAGALRERFPATFPSGQGSDLAGSPAGRSGGRADMIPRRYGLCVARRSSLGDR